MSGDTKNSSANNDDESSSDKFSGWTCDQITPDLCDLIVTEGRIPIREDGLYVHYWKYSSADNVNSVDNDNEQVPSPPPLYPVVVLHGGPGMPHNYMLPLKQLACRPDRYGRTRDIYFYDQGGCGESVHPVSNRSTQNASNSQDHANTLVDEHPYLLDPMYYATVELPKVLDHLLGSNSNSGGYHLVANSWGTILAQYFVLDYYNPKREAAHQQGGIDAGTDPSLFPELASMTLSGPLSDGDLYVRSQWADAEDGGYNNLGQLPPFVRNRIHGLEKGNAYGSAEYQAIDESLTGRFTCRIVPAPDCFAVSASGPGLNEDVYVGIQGPSEFTLGGVLEGFNLTGRLPAIEVPVLLTSGAFDTMRPPVVDALYQALPLAEWTMSEFSGHVTMIDDAGWTNGVVDDFLGRVEGATTPLGSNGNGSSSSFRPIPERCGPAGCVPKETAVRNARGIVGDATIDGTGIGDNPVIVSFLSLIAGLVIGRYLLPTNFSSRRVAEGYESI
ncbi:unnamed protein product [Pseudo-nitzschia multistriata]|uniref:AB hydrolase-1 domain-containing protein n=1 Tax=Pseudo-nitzschia multistriata TaxID=183589 RepID=A0A448ZTD6_9STRA|nr:unnamed protein product [Pseudo-nitzschia multistriata]